VAPKLDSKVLFIMHFSFSTGLDNGFLLFDHVKVPRENLLNRFGDVDANGNYISQIKNPNKRFGAMLAQLTMGRTGIVNHSANFLSLGLRVAIGFSYERRQFGITHEIQEVPVMTYQAQKLKIFPALSECIAYTIASQHLTKKYEQRSPETLQELHITSAGLKAYISDRTAKILILLREACGGHGYNALNRLGEWRDSQDISRTFEGDNTILLQEVSQYLLKQYRERYKATGFASVLDYVGDSFHNYFQGGKLMGFAGPITDNDYIAQLFEFRTKRLTHTGALRYRNILEKLSKQHVKGEDKKKQKARDKFTSWNHVQTHFLDAARSHIEYEILNLFIDTVKSCPDQDVCAVLDRLCSLFALSILERDLAWFVLHKCISEENAKKVKRSIIQLCQSFSEADTKAVIATFPISYWSLMAPIAGHFVRDADSRHEEWSSTIYRDTVKRALDHQCFGNARKNLETHN
jgi:acyl-CoA oxidase